MKGTTLKKHRQEAGLTQQRLAARLDLTQAYLSLMERGRRKVPDHVARAVAHRLRLPVTALPLPPSPVLDTTVNESWVEQRLARLGYPGFAYLRKAGPRCNPAELLLRALALDDLDPRLTEALPCLLLMFEGFDVQQLTTLAKTRDLQNRLGFTVSLARQVAEQNPRYQHRLGELRSIEGALERSRLAREGTYGRRETSERMRAWLCDNRSSTAAHWNLMTDLKVEHLPYAG